MRHYLIPSLILVAVCLSLLIPQASALPVSYNQTALNFGLTSVPRNSSSYDVFPLIPDNWLWEKFDNNTIDSSNLGVTGTITYNTNLKALWKFENVLTDSSSNGFTLTKTAGTNNFASGQEGQAIKFDGSTYYSASSSSIVTGTNDRSVTFWIKTPSSFTGNTYIFSWGAQSANNLFAGTWVSSGSSSTLRLQGWTNDVISNTVFQPNTWYHIGLSSSSSGTVRTIYVNGAQDIQSTTTAINTSSSSFFLGSFNGASIVDTGTIVDEFRIYNIAISLAQDKALYMVGHYSQSHTFDGGEYVSLGNTLGFERTNPFSITFWMKSGNPPASASVLGKGGFNAEVGYDVFALNGNTLGFDLQNTGGSNELSVSYTSSGLFDGNWHYVSWVYDGSSLAGNVKLNIDGLSQNPTIVVNNLSSSILSANNFVIGTNSGVTNPFTGQLDNVKVYPYALSSSQVTSDYNSISPISSGKQFMSYYHGISGSSTLTNKLGYGSTTTLSCSLNSANPNPPIIVSNASNIYYGCPVGAGEAIKKFDVIQNTNSHIYTSLYGSSPTSGALFMGIKHIFSSSASSSGFGNQLNSEKGNVTQGSTGGTWLTSNQEIQNTVTYTIKFNDNSTAVRAVSNTNLCNINYNPTNTTKSLENIACDQAVPAMAIKYYNGMLIQKIGGYNTNSTQFFLNSIDSSAYKKLLSLPCLILVNETPCITFIATDQTQTDWLVVLTSTHVYYGNAQTALHLLQNNNYALQSYDIVTPLTTSAYEIQNPILQGITLYGFNLNMTTNKAGLMTLPSGYTTKTTTINSAIRTIDPRWTNDLTDIPIITTSQSLFPIFLTVSNTPAFSAIKVTQGTQIINNLESVYAVAQLDSTRSVEVDLVAGTCANVYIADISISPSIWNFQGIICATGVNQKTLAYTNTLPLSFFTLKYGVSDSYVPSNNGLTTSFHTQNSPTTYNVLVKNSTGAIAINQTFTVPANQTLDTRSFNVSSVSKPAVLVVNVAGNQIYSSYLGSPLSLASMASFFHQYFSYQGFDLLSFIPIFFASMFTRNTVGIGMALVVVLIASLSWLSVVTIPDTSVYMAIFIACIGMVGYRGYQAYG